MDVLYNVYIRYKLNAKDCLSAGKTGLWYNEWPTRCTPLTVGGNPKIKRVSSLLSHFLFLTPRPELHSRNNIPYNVPMKNRSVSRLHFHNFPAVFPCSGKSVHIYCLVIICASGSALVCVIYRSYILTHPSAFNFVCTSTYRT